MKLSTTILHSAGAGFGWTIGKNFANKGSGCMSIIVLLLIALSAKVIAILL